MIRELAQFVENNTSFVIGTDFFVGYRPQEKPDRCVSIHETAGGVVYGEIPDRVDKNVQFISRAVDYYEARTDIWTIYEFFHGRAGDTLPLLTSGYNYYVYVSDALADPQYLGEDEKRRHEFSVNIEFKIANP